MTSLIVTVLQAGVAAVSGGLLLIAGYLAFLTAAAGFARRRGPPAAPGRRRFAVLVPAHDEELLIGRLLRNLRQLDYPEDGFDVHVVADNCSDETATRARWLGAQVHERTDRTAQSKGHALRWLLQRVVALEEGYDAYVVLDADSVVDRNFLRAMDARLESGSQVVQAYYGVLNASASPVAGLRYAALAAIHYVRPLGRSALGLSCGLKGNGMCFAAGVLERFSWSWFALAEDVEFHLALVKEGIRVDFAPETTVLADMPVTFGQAASQNARWERGRLELMRRHVPDLLWRGLVRRSPLRLDAAVEQLIPPLSVPFALGCVCLAAGLLLRQPLLALLAALGLAGQVVHLLVGLLMVGAPPRTYLALVYAPAYVLWKVWLYLRAMAGGGSAPWVRTARAPAATGAFSSDHSSG
jgi:cellulose synthase/poly-beta-1,6-N-acetylglucosamine synthase-like glycosyltransferase